MLCDVLPDLSDPRPLDARVMRKGRIVRPVHRFNRAGLTIFEDSHVEVTRAKPQKFPPDIRWIVEK